MKIKFFKRIQKFAFKPSVLFSDLDWLCCLSELIFHCPINLSIWRASWIQTESIASDGKQQAHTKEMPAYFLSLHETKTLHFQFIFNYCNYSCRLTRCVCSLGPRPTDDSARERAKKATTYSTYLYNTIIADRVANSFFSRCCYCWEKKIVRRGLCVPV